MPNNKIEDKWECDKFLNEPDLFRIEEKKLEQMKLNAFKEVFKWHYEKCDQYRTYCNMYNITPSVIKEYKDLARIPPIPSDVFRETEVIRSIPKEEIVKVLTTSSTTSKIPSKFPFDAFSLKRIGLLCSKVYSALMNAQPSKGSLVCLTPPPSKSDTGLVGGVVILGKTLNLPTSFVFDEKEIDFEKVVGKIENSISPRYLYGPPFAFIYLVEYLQSKNKTLKLNGMDMVTTTGGWKGVKKEVSAEKFRKMVSSSFDIPQENIRDMLGLTDIMQILPECEYHHKHVPPYVHISIRNPTDITKELKDGEEGLIVYMASTVRSYPAFALTGDLGMTWNSKCECGRTGQRIEIKGRVSVGGQRGCAIRLEQFMQGISRKESA